ncbi:octanoyltransferase [Burkholderia sp. THE68]|uniref:lipoyl(octanoyl) transferase LipB n=1 Tax=Burkholderiaceae TaxID=119060 RepID=UPI0013195E7A|nr:MULTISPECIES: lipoyl(octanoyl) transferase LipB [Burkholderiaceae]BBU26434.1 octanoyltransferase [Burkholderia sp. THE68]BCQ22065.1 lipoyl(octanoyl) transferase LipB [Caballeronia sp. NK8]
MSATPLAVPQAIHDASDTVLSSGEFPVALRWRGREPYGQSFDAMRAFTDARTPETQDEIWLVEHPPVFTLGLAGDPAHLLLAGSGIPLVKVDRGGQITYHGPGQIVAYLLIDLRRRKLMVRELVRRIEEAVIETLATYNLATDRKPGAPGIYVAGPSARQADRGANVRLHELHQGAKIAALGLKIRNGCSYHGVSLNVNMDLQPFLAINPCGYAGLETVDMATLGVAADWRDVALVLAERLALQIGGLPAIAAATTGSTE